MNISMTSKILIFLSALALAINPFFSFSQASTSWEPIQAEAAWSYDGYRVERLAFSHNALGPVVFGNHVLVAEPSKMCVQIIGCDRLDVYVLKNGQQLRLENVPRLAFDAKRYALNGNRFVYLSSSDNESNDRYDLM